MRVATCLFLMGLGIVLVQCSPNPDSPMEPQLYNCSSTIDNTHPNADKFQTFLAEKVEQGLPGISMVLETPEGIWAGAAGVANIPGDIDMKSCSLHKIGSITKMFTASLIFQLYEAGGLQFEDPISKYLDDDIINRLPNGRDCTIKHLLNHSSGIPDFLDLQYSLDYFDNPKRVFTALEDIAYVYGESADFRPGTKVKYSNTNYTLLGLIAERITHKTGTQLYQDMIFDPLAMTASHFDQNGEKPSNLVRGYYDESGNGHFLDITDHTYVTHSMAGGASSTVRDLHTFLKASLDGNTLYLTETIHLATTLENIPFDDPDNFDFGDGNKVKGIKGIGLGWFELETQYGRAYGHNGGYNGRRARMWYFPESQSSIVFMYNGSGESLKSVGKELFRNEMVELLFE
ncbi:MAG: serine hydrolase domain-containing protein [Flavobacteriaceae bacterium]